MIDEDWWGHFLKAIIHRNHDISTGRLTKICRRLFKFFLLLAMLLLAFYCNSSLKTFFQTQNIYKLEASYFQTPFRIIKNQSTATVSVACWSPTNRTSIIIVITIKKMKQVLETREDGQREKGGRVHSGLV